MQTEINLEAISKKYSLARVKAEQVIFWETA